MRTIQVKIAAGATEELAVTGDYVRLKLAPYDVTIENTQTSEKVEGSQGDDFQLSPFTGLRVTNLGGVDSVFKLTIATGKKAGSAPGVISGSVAVSNFPAGSALNGAFTQGRVSLTNVNQVIIAANANRRSLIIQNNDAAQVMRVTLNGVAATAAQGFRIPAGDSLDLSDYLSTGAVNAIMEVATAAAGNVEFAEG
jgi:hypothetical protein